MFELMYLHITHDQFMIATSIREIYTNTLENEQCTSIQNQKLNLSDHKYDDIKHP